MGKVSSSVQSQGIQLPPNLAGENPLHEQAVVPKPKEILVKAVPITEIQIKAVPMRIPEKSSSYGQAISATAPVLIPIERRKLRHIF